MLDTVFNIDDFDLIERNIFDNSRRESHVDRGREKLNSDFEVVDADELQYTGLELEISEFAPSAQPIDLELSQLTPVAQNQVNPTIAAVSPQEQRTLNVGSSSLSIPDVFNQSPLDLITQFFPRIDSSQSSRDGFNIDLISVGLTGSQQNVLREAANFWETIITSDLPDIQLGPITLIDDLLIGALGSDIDGEGNILGQAGPVPESLRASLLPSIGAMQFDTADLAGVEAAGQLDDLFLHEIGHVLGIGTLWEDFDLVTNLGTNDPRYIGENATVAYNEIFGVEESSVPIANTGGEGTREAHWRESIFDNELMTGFLNSGVGVNNPLSQITAASLVDLGYDVDLETAELYSPPDVLNA